MSGVGAARRWAAAGALGALALLLGLASWLDRSSTDEAARAARELVAGFRARAVQRFALRRDGVELVFERRPGAGDAVDEWLLRGLGRADAGEVARALEAVEDARVARVVGGGAPAEVGLATPRVELVLDGGATLAIGGRDATGGGVYVARHRVTAGAGGCLARGGGAVTGGGGGARGGDEVVVTDAHLGDVLDRPSEVWRDRTLTAAPTTRVRSLARLELRGDGAPSLVLTRDGGERWRTIASRGAAASGAGETTSRADPARAAALVDTLATARLVRFVAPSALPPRGAAEVVLVDGEERLRIGGDCPAAPDRRAADAPATRAALAPSSPSSPELLVRRADGAVGCVARGDVGPLLVARRDAATGAFVGPRPFPLAPTEVTEVTLRDGAGAELTVRRGAAGWVVSAPDRPAAPADEEVVRAWLVALAATRGRPVDGLPSAGAAFVQLAARTRDGERLRLIVTAAPRELAFRDDEPIALSPDAPLAPLLRVDPLRFRPRRVLSLRAPDVTAVTVDGTPVERASGAPGGWRSSGGAVDARAVAALLDRLAALRALDLLAPPRAPESSPALAAPVRRLRVASAGSPDVVLSVGAPGAGGACTATLGGDPTLLRLDRATCADLRGVLVRRR